MHYIGIDLGGTKISGAIFNENGNILFQDSLLIEDRKGKEVGELIIFLCKKICSKGGIDITGEMSIGVCVPGIAYSKTGCVWAPNIPNWENYPIASEMKRHFPKALITIESDRTCYILGEITMGVAKGCNDAIFLAVGTGIGAGIIIDGNILHGASDIIGAIGWMALKPPYSDKYNKCGCFESHASGGGLASQAKYLLTQDKNYNGMLRQYQIDKITSYEVFAAHLLGDPIALKVINQAVEMWGMAAANMVSLFNPELVIFGGGVFGPAIPLIDRIYDEACKWAQPISIKETKFVATQLPKMAGLYGAGAAAMKAYKERNK
jgi:glucokinase